MSTEGAPPPAPAQSDADSASTPSSARDQVSGYDKVTGTHRIGSCRRELLDRTLVWNQRHLMIVMGEYEEFYNTHRPHRALKQAPPLRPPPPDGIADPDHFRVQRRDRAVAA